MDGFSSRLYHFVVSKGIDPSFLGLVVGLAFLWLSVRDFRRWNKFSFWQKWLIVSCFLGSIGLVFWGIMFLLFLK